MSQPRAPGGHPPHSLILETVTRVVFPTIWVFSLYLLFAGHNAPGGGFVGGLVGGAALVLHYAAHGGSGVAQVMRPRPEALLGCGLALAGLTGAAALALGGQYLQSAKVELDVPLLGHVEASSALSFDAGVYLIVVGLIQMVLATLGEQEPEARDPAAPEAAPEEPT